MKKNHFDVIILGAGLVGLTLANLCAQQGFIVALLESKYPSLDWNSQAFDLRCSAISRGSQHIFEQIGVWDLIRGDRVSPYRNMLVWDAAGYGEITFDAAEVGEPDLGHIIENRVMQKALFEKATQNPNITILVPIAPEALEVTAEYAVLTLNDAAGKFSEIYAKCVIGADGGNSWLRETAKFVVEKQDYHQTALVATVVTELPHQATAWQRFLPEGPLAFLPLLDAKYSSIVWTSTPEKIAEFLRLSEQERCEALTYFFDYRLGKVLSISPVLTFPLKSIQVKNYIKERVALLGDAAHVIHPLAGQGVNLGLSDAKILAFNLLEAKQQGSDIGHYRVLRKYERARKGQVAVVQGLMSFFKNLFGSQNSLVIGLRSMGLACLEQSKSLKRKIIQQAMGI